jgi:hypothetical protein
VSARVKPESGPIAGRVENLYELRNNCPVIDSVLRGMEMRCAVLITFVTIASHSFADELIVKGHLSGPAASTHDLTDAQCLRVLHNYASMSEAGRARIEGITSLCRSRLSGQLRPASPNNSTEDANQQMQAVVPRVPGQGVLSNSIQLDYPVK